MLIFAFDFRFHLLAGYAASIDPELRDTFGYEILSTWIHRSGKFYAAALDSLRRQFSPYAREGLGEGNERDLRGYAGVRAPANKLAQLAALIARQKNPAVPAALARVNWSRLSESPSISFSGGPPSSYKLRRFFTGLYVVQESAGLSLPRALGYHPRAPR